MKLSELQLYIMKECLEKGRLNKSVFLNFYTTKKINKKTALNDIVKSIERLISRDYVKAQGVKTAKKWYTETVILTAKGRKMARKLLDKQQRLPLNN